jgi:hypothetical protein
MNAFHGFSCSVPTAGLCFDFILKRKLDARRGKGVKNELPPQENG